MNSPQPVRTIEYPRVLLVTLPKVMADDPVNLLIRTQFGDWPKERLAQIHSGETGGEGEFCGRYYRLQVCDRRWGRLFGRLRRDVADMVAPCALGCSRGSAPRGLLRRWMSIGMRKTGDLLINSGLWEILFAVRLSDSMSRFIREFKADIIYCQGYSLGFASLPLQISKRCGIPICFQTTDDWPHRAYRHSPVRWLIRRRARQLIEHAAVRLAFGEKMRQAYEIRYGVPFGVSYHLDDPARFPRDPANSAGICRIVYTGSLGHRRFEAIQDVLAAARSLECLRGGFEMLVYCTSLPKDMPRELLQSPEVKLVPLPSHDELPAVLASATVLLLPESFNEAPEAIEYSISTKAHLYMMSGRPILVYGPAHSGTVEYATREGWAAVVTTRTPESVKAALGKLLSDAEYKAELLQRACRCIESNHRLQAGRENVRRMIAQAAATSPAARW